MTVKNFAPRKEENGHIPPLTIRGVKCPILIDWCQASVKLPLKKEVSITQKLDDKGNVIEQIKTEKMDINSYEPKGGFLFTVERSKRGSMNFKRVYEISTIYNGELEVCATLEMEAHVDFIPRDVAIIKIHNKFLYGAEIFTFVDSLLKELNVAFNHWTRLDFAMDFQELELYESKNPEDFLAAYDAGLLRMKGRKSFMKDKEETGVETGSLRVSSTGQMYKAITWGCYASGKKIIMYNKSKEMAQKSLKPWILQTWEANGFAADRDTWRIEFCVRKDLEELYTAEDMEKSGGAFEDIESLSFLVFELIKPENYTKYFRAFYHKHFVFAKNEKSRTGKRKKFCQCTPVKVFNLKDEGAILQRFSEKSKSSNMEKYHIKKLVETVEHYTGSHAEICEATLKVIADKVHKYHLYKWFSQKYPGIDIFRQTMTNLREKYNVWRDFKFNPEAIEWN